MTLIIKIKTGLQTYEKTIFTIYVLRMHVI